MYRPLTVTEITMLTDENGSGNNLSSLSIQWTRLTINCKVGEIS